MLPEQSWFDKHGAFSQPVRAQTFRPYRQSDRARQILVIMRDFVKRRSKIQEDALPKNSAFDSVNAEPLPSPVPVRDDEKPRPPLPPADADRARKRSLADRERPDD